MNPKTPVIVIAPDSLKGSCSSVQAARAIARGVRAAFGERADVRELPMADGGEGTLDALVAAWGGDVTWVETSDALGRPGKGRVGFELSNERAGSASRLRAIIEAADANGLPAVLDQPLRPLDADSVGVGALILAALDAGADELLLCIGGSGMLRALGARLLDAQGCEVAVGARGLLQLHSIDLRGIDPRAARASWRIACDVDNPLIGPRGAAAVFGPQKGATAEEVEQIDKGLATLARLLAQEAGVDALELQARAGLGAAGGLALGPCALFGAELLPGAQLVSDAIGLPAALADATIVFTGEGRLDSQSLDGKVVSQVLAEASPDTPVFVIAGSNRLSGEALRDAGIAAAFSIAQGPATLDEMRAEASRLLEDTARQVCGAILAAAKIEATNSASD